MGTAWRGPTTLTIASGGTASAELDLKQSGSRRRMTLLIIAPATLPETTKIHVAAATGGTYGVLQSGGSDITLAAGKATIIDALVAGALKIVAGTTAADRAFIILGTAAQ